MRSTLLTFIIHTGVAANAINWDCNRTWPQLDLFLPVCLTRGRDVIRHYEVETLFLRSFLLFWPLELSKTLLNVVVDSETEGSHQYKELNQTLQNIAHKIPGGVRMSSSSPSTYYRTGHDRQQLMMFWADNYTTAEYVGFVDTDCVFVTYVDREDLFEDGLPVVNGRSGRHDPNDIWSKLPISTFLSLKILEPMRCMSYFPVVIRVKHLKELRAYIEKIHGKRFNEVFYEVISAQPYCQFCIMCTYLFTYHRDEYRWYVHSETPGWDGKDPPPNPGQDGNLSTLFTKEMYFPKPRVATHARYRGHREFNIIKHVSNMNMMLQRGVCMSPPLPRVEPICHTNQDTDKDGFFEEMHRFEFFDGTNYNINSPESLREAFSERQERLQNCTHHWNPEEMEAIMKPQTRT